MCEKFSIRRATSLDLDNIYELEQDVFSGNFAWSLEVLDKLIDNFSSLFTVVVSGDKLLGYAVSHFNGDTVDLETICVSPAKRNRGIASKLLEVHIREAEEINASAILLEVAKGNSPAMNLYNGFGFEQIDVRKKYYKDDDAIIMRKIL